MHTIPIQYMYMPSYLSISILGLMFMIHTDDHEPAHVTVYKGTPESHEAKARIEIETGEVMDGSFGFSEKALRKLSQRVLDRQDFLRRKWNATRPKK